MHYIIQILDLWFGHHARHARGFAAALTVAAIVARLADETAAARKRIGARASVARQAAVAAAMDAPTLTLPVVVGAVRIAWQDPATAIRNAVIVQGGKYITTPPKALPSADPEPTLPMTRAELLALAEAEQWRPEGSRPNELTVWERDLLELAGPEVDGGRPLHELDFALVTGGAR
ncbi:hypothetical protein [Nocardia sp. NPDC058633]|uniref:hypothetical protein n=1 Tax=Nocardia sp. NPDC058633 TaxID=3346568 RepID=UPI0036696BF5